MASRAKRRWRAAVHQQRGPAHVSPPRSPLGVPTSLHWDAVSFPAKGSTTSLWQSSMVPISDQNALRDVPSPSMALAEVLVVLQALDIVGCRHWLEGGWGVDALVGRQTRPHRDLDVDFDAAYEAEALAALQELGYVVETDWRPNRVELVAPARGWIDLHPLLLDEDGSARQAALDEGYHRFDRSWFTVGELGGRPVPCVTAQAQRLFREGYEHRPVDRHDLDLLEELDRGRSPRHTEALRKRTGLQGLLIEPRHLGQWHLRNLMRD
jgi:lincosamide nucleotidyltransferase A/C/D/E